MTVELRERRQRWRRLRAVRPNGLPVPRFAVINKKGGSGKTTSSVQLSGIFASWGLTTRLTDADPQQASSTFWLANELPAGSATLYDVFAGGATLDKVTYPTAVDGLLIVPSNSTLDRVESERPPGTDMLMAAEYRCGSVHDVDVEICDAAPSIGTVTVSVLAGASHILISMKPSGLDAVGATEIDGPLELIKARLNPELSIAAVLLVDADNRADFTKDMRAQIEADYPDAIVASIPHSVEAQKAPLAHEPMHMFAPNNPVTDAYYELAEALLITVGFELVEVEA